MPKNFPSPVTTIFSRRVRPGFEDRYEEWLKGIIAATSEFPGSQGTTVLRPGPSRQEYVALVQFDSAENLERWLVSEERAHWLGQLESITLDCEATTSMTGMERWFTLPDQAVAQAPPKHKMALLVLLGLYPMAMILNPMARSVIGEWPQAIQSLITMMISIALMVWFVMPQLTRLFFDWLHPGHRASRLTQPKAVKPNLPD